MNERPKHGRAINIEHTGWSPERRTRPRTSPFPQPLVLSGEGTPYTAPRFPESSELSRADARMKSPPRDFGITGLDHIDLRVSNRPKLARFFAEQLGMDVLGEGPDHTFLLFGDQVLGLRDPKEGEKPTGLDHIALRVTEWTGLKSRVTRARVTITGEKERDDSRSLYLRGPDGIKIELVWRPDPSAHTCEHAPAVVPVPKDE
jgi:catechol 2,3-dioxygenase-like lactoylglutathione lyase family enzyme